MVLVKVAQMLTCVHLQVTVPCIQSLFIEPVLPRGLPAQTRPACTWCSRTRTWPTGTRS